MTVAVRFTVNGRLVERAVPARRSLTDFLRGDLGLTGTHVGCEHGVCGACTVLLDGRTARSVLTNKCPSGANRGIGKPFMCFAIRAPAPSGSASTSSSTTAGVS